jgi:hypothetical protein
MCACSALGLDGKKALVESTRELMKNLMVEWCFRRQVLGACCSNKTLVFIRCLERTMKVRDSAELVLISLANDVLKLQKNFLAASRLCFHTKLK